MGRGSSGVTKQTPTHATTIENMNEAQLDREIAKVTRTIQAAEKAMRGNDATQTAVAKGMREAFPLGAGGGLNTKQFGRRMEADARMAARYTLAYDRRNVAQTRLDALKKAKADVAGTGKTQSQLASEKRAQAVKNTPITSKWTTVTKGGWNNGAYTPKTIRSGDYTITSSGSMHSIYRNGQLLGRTSKLSEAKAVVERLKKRR